MMATLCSPAFRCRRCGRKLTVRYTKPSTTFRATPAGVVCLTMESRVASPSVGYASTTPSRKLFCGLLTGKRQPRPSRPKRKRLVAAIRSAML